MKINDLVHRTIHYYFVFLERMFGKEIWFYGFLVLNINDFKMRKREVKSELYYEVLCVVFSMLFTTYVLYLLQS